ncbi:IS3 family transposase [Arcanobacterium phocae]|uniref:IS3 family transposase n=1 Tax=Arcanobacterium phocae TaxID=131112 RepID=UPI0012F83765
MLKNAGRIDADLELVKQAYAYSYGRYGYRRLTYLIRRGFQDHEGRCMNHKKVARLMRQAGLYGMHPRRKREQVFRFEHLLVFPTVCNVTLVFDNPVSAWLQILRRSSGVEPGITCHL